MNSKQSNKLNMYLAVEVVLTTFALVMAGFTKFAGFFTALQTEITQIRACDQEQMVDKTGIAVGKGQLKATVVTLIADLCRKLRAYATMENNQPLLSETDISESRIKRCPDNELLGFAQGICARGTEHLIALVPYGYTALNHAALEEAIASYQVSIPTPRIGTIDTRQSTLEMAQAFEETDEAIANIDILVEVLKLSKPEFYSTYKSARKIIDLGTGSLGVKGLITDSGTGEGLSNATVSFALEGSENGMRGLSGISGTPGIEKKSALKGGFNIKSLAQGVYSVTVKKYGYADQMTTLNVTSGELALLNVKMVKNLN